MKFKKLGFETKEGLSLANYEDGWSMEYGAGGSYTVDVMFNGKKVANVIEEGNGGPVMISYYTKDHKVEDKKVLECLSRIDDDFKDLDKVNDYLKTNDVTYATLIEALLNRKTILKEVNKLFKKGYMLVACFDNGYQSRQVATIDTNEQALLDYAKKNGLLTKGVKVSMFNLSNPNVLVEAY